MVRVLIQRGGDGRICGFQVRGHAGFDLRGKDVVCAAVSAVTQCAVVALEQWLQLQPEVTAREGYLDCRLPQEMPPRAAQGAEDILEGMVCGLEAIATSYPGHVGLVEAGNVSKKPRM